MRHPEPQPPPLGESADDQVGMLVEVAEARRPPGLSGRRDRPPDAILLMQGNEEVTSDFTERTAGIGSGAFAEPLD